MVKMKPINVSNTTLSLNGRKRHRKFDAKQAKRHDFGKAHCAICDKVFTKYAHNAKMCSEEKCKRERKLAKQRKYYEENREKKNAISRKYYEENREKINAINRKYYEENREKINSKRRARYRANKEK